jgi:crossover junction endodeoxyribonuclease RusA
MITLHLPYPPSVNNYWIASGHRRFISKRGKDFKEYAADYCAKTEAHYFGGVDVRVTIILHPRSKILMDIDNCSKAILDSLQGVMYDDDAQVQQLLIQRGHLKKGGGCTVIVEHYKPSMSLSVNLPMVDS